MKNHASLATLCPRLFAKSIKTGSKIVTKETKILKFHTKS